MAKSTYRGRESTKITPYPRSSAVLETTSRFSVLQVTALQVTAPSSSKFRLSSGSVS